MESAFNLNVFLRIQNGKAFVQEKSGLLQQKPEPKPGL
jgi:hypothetical protein